MFDNLSNQLDRAFKVLKGHGKITEINIAETLKEVRRALIEADVSYLIAKEFTDSVKQKALGQQVLTAVEPGQLMVKIVKDQLTELMGGDAVEVNTKGSPSVILIAGLQGSGKTTFSAKLANQLKNKKGKSVLLVAGDVYRPAAINQLQVLGEQVGVKVYTEDIKNPVKIASNAVAYAKEMGIQVVIVDTAGRLAVDEDMMQEIAEIKRQIRPQETLFVVDAMTGQDAVNTAKAFHDRLDFDGVVLTKLDGDTRGGAALTIRSVVKKPIKLVGIGEKIDALDVFYPERMASRILGMGDIVSFVEKAQEQFDEEQARKMTKRIHANEFNFEDFLDHIRQIQKMGNMKDLMGLIPGFGKMVKNMDFDEQIFVQMEAIIGSMTPFERQNPSQIDSSRRKRIAAGSGTTVEQVNKLMKHFSESQKMMKMVSSNKLNAMTALKNMKKQNRR